MPTDGECNHGRAFFPRSEDYVPCAACGREAVITDIDAERIRQMSSEGWTLQHDDGHPFGNMAQAAACYIIHAVFGDFAVRYWPWENKWWKPSTPRRDLVKAGALIVAEIERLDRKTSKQKL